jgi:hypothetical protein
MSTLVGVKCSSLLFGSARVVNICVQTLTSENERLSLELARAKYQMYVSGARRLFFTSLISCISFLHRGKKVREYEEKVARLLLFITVTVASLRSCPNQSRILLFSMLERCTHAAVPRFPHFLCCMVAVFAERAKAALNIASRSCLPLIVTTFSSMVPCSTLVCVSHPICVFRSVHSWEEGQIYIFKDCICIDEVTLCSQPCSCSTRDHFHCG